MIKVNLNIQLFRASAALSLIRPQLKKIGNGAGAGCSGGQLMLMLLVAGARKE
jgi:hypothetical protein